MAKAENNAHPTECLNCGTTLQGQWCHQCGQKSRSEVRHFSSVVTDILDTVFEYDNRIWRTLLPLYFNPGKISKEFMAGRRVRYVLPFRLFFVLSVVMFLTLQFSSAPQRLAGVGLVPENARFERFESEAEVIAERDRVLAELQINLQELESDTGSGAELARRGLITTMQVVEETSQSRLAELRGEPDVAVPADDTASPEDTTASVEDPATPEAGPPAEPAARPEIIIVGSQAWHPETNPVAIGWLPANMNAAINNAIERGLLNVQSVSEDPAALIEAMLNLLPLVLFFMMPVFALLLKFFYLFSRHLYMEHFIVALHSHSFLFFAVLISLSLNALSGIESLPDGVAWTLTSLYSLSLIWIPLYLLLMQRRVYGQGWVFTTVKYSAIGMLYVMMLVFTLLAAALISLVML